MVAALSSTPALAQQASKPQATAASAPDERMEWELRRQRFLRTLDLLRESDPTARLDFQRRVRDFEIRPFSLTPLEAMDYIGAVFVPQVGVEKMLPLIAAQAALGLYDVERFGSTLGEAHLVEVEGFLRKPLTLGGPEQTAQARAFLRDQPELAARLVREGLELANGERIGTAYDAQWVRGLGRCAPTIARDCPAWRNVPSTDWDDVWAHVKTRVTAYYRVEADRPAVVEADRPAVTPAPPASTAH